MPLRRCALDGYITFWIVVDVANGGGGIRFDGFSFAAVICVEGRDGDGFADLLLGEREGVAGGISNGFAIGVPLIGNIAEAICIRQVVAGR